MWMVDLLNRYLSGTKDQSVYADLIDPNKCRANSKDKDTYPYNQLGTRNGRAKWGALACGSEVSRFCRKYLGGVEVAFFPYFDQANGRQVENFVFDAKKLSRGVNKITKLISAGTAVRLPLIYDRNPGDDDFKLRGNYVVPMHYVGVVGYRIDKDGDTRFLYIDPYPGFSTTTYYGHLNDFMGELSYDSGHPSLWGLSLGRELYAYAGPI